MGLASLRLHKQIEKPNLDVAECPRCKTLFAPSKGRKTGVFSCPNCLYAPQFDGGIPILCKNCHQVFNGTPQMHASGQIFCPRCHYLFIASGLGLDTMGTRRQYADLLVQAPVGKEDTSPRIRDWREEVVETLRRRKLSNLLGD